MNVLNLRKLLAPALLAAVLTTGCASLETGARPVEPANLGQLKTELTRYHDSGNYERDLTAVAAQAQAYVEARATHVTRPALVLDIDETSLTNWGVMAANDFGYIPQGPCATPPTRPCGQVAWQDSGQATAIAGTLALYNAARARNVAVFFVTGRRENERAGTERNLRQAGYTEWAAVVLKPQDSHATAAEYKSGARASIEAQGYTIIANVGDQLSDLAGGHAERTFKLPNPYYFIP